jgi:hypothetical protein
LDKIKTSRKNFLSSGVLAIICSISVTLTIYLLFLQTPLLSIREIISAFLLFIICIYLSYSLIDRFLLPQIRVFSQRAKIALIVSSLIFGIFIIGTTNYPNLYFASPNRTVKILIPAASKNINYERTVSVIWITTNLGDVGFSQLLKEGKWRETESGTSHTGPDPASLLWEGNPGDEFRIEFQRTPYSNPILIVWDDQETQIDLAGPLGTTQTIAHAYSPMNSGQLFALIIIGLSSAFLFLFVSVFLLSRQLKFKPSSPLPKYSWLYYTLPMVAVWGLYLLTFFPGMMSADSNDQWGQILTGQFNDTHPVFHTLSMWLVTRIWLSPAAVVISQILFLSLTVAWGIRLLREHGLPAWAGWTLATVFALAPLNGNMVIVLWKDIPYSTSLFLLSLMILKIVLTNGNWLEKRFTWVWLGLVSLCVASFRHNGFPVPIASLIALLIFYRKWWKKLIQAALLAVLLYGGIHGPFYKALGVGQRQLGFMQDIMLHHIAAHIKNGETLLPAEQALADSILPPDQWKYNCCTALSIMLSPNYPGLSTTVQGPAIRKLFITLAIKEPLVELNHLKCISSIVWRSPGFCGANTLLPAGRTLWIIGVPVKYFSENSLIPSLQKPLSAFLVALRVNPSFTLFVSPGVYLSFGIFATVIFSIRRKNWKGLLFILPIVIQSVTFVLINTSDNFRYHYGVYLVGLFGIGLLILALEVSSSNTNSKLEHR